MGKATNLSQKGHFIILILASALGGTASLGIPPLPAPVTDTQPRDVAAKSAADLAYAACKEKMAAAFKSASKAQALAGQTASSENQLSNQTPVFGTSATATNDANGNLLRVVGATQAAKKDSEAAVTAAEANVTNATAEGKAAAQEKLDKAKTVAKDVETNNKDAIRDSASAIELCKTVPQNLKASQAAGGGNGGGGGGSGGGKNGGGSGGGSSKGVALAAALGIGAAAGVAAAVLASQSDDKGDAAKQAQLDQQAREDKARKDADDLAKRNAQERAQLVQAEERQKAAEDKKIINLLMANAAAEEAKAKAAERTPVRLPPMVAQAPANVPGAQQPGRGMVSAQSQCSSVKPQSATHCFDKLGAEVSCRSKKAARIVKAQPSPDANCDSRALSARSLRM